MLPSFKRSARSSYLCGCPFTLYYDDTETLQRMVQSRKQRLCNVCRRKKKRKQLTGENQ